MIINSKPSANGIGAGIGIGASILATSVALTLISSVSGTIYYFRDYISPENYEKQLSKKTKEMSEEIIELKKKGKEILEKKDSLERKISELKNEIEKVKSESEERVIHAEPELSAKLAVKENELAKLKLQTSDILKQINYLYHNDPDIKNSKKHKQDKAFILTENGFDFIDTNKTKKNNKQLQSIIN